MGSWQVLRIQAVFSTDPLPSVGSETDRLASGVGADGGLGQVSSSNSGKERWDPVTSLKVNRIDVE